ncbi:MAG: fumarate hydrolyase [Chloroflexi bacterium HGW-Chloroflexi-4]|jgi:fumarate hydratase class I|nr:MAG: fumarate hydrolyase [Chloroflexi bacterium HGW-Chloroflexi-4]
MEKHLNIPISADEIRDLKVGESVLLSGIMITGRDAVHKWIHDTFIDKTKPATQEDLDTLSQLKPILDGGLIYHCGPVVSGLETKQYRFVAAGPTTSIREEPYQGDVIHFLNLRGVIGKGGMGPKTLKACHDAPAVYFHAIGGAAALIAESVTEVIGVHKLEFGIPEAIWVIKVKDLPVIVTMDSHNASLHTSVRDQSKSILNRLIEG